MSDPVTNVQIEDVLSSIRKLVSEEVRSQTRPRVAAAPQAERSNMLILTSAHRVAEPGAEAAETADSAERDYGGGAAAGEGSFDLEAFSKGLSDDGSAEAETEVAEMENIETAESGTELSDWSEVLTSEVADENYEDEDTDLVDAPLDLSQFAQAEVSDAAEPIDEGDEMDETAEAVVPIPSFLRSRGGRLREVPAAQSEAAGDGDEQGAGSLVDAFPEDAGADPELWAEAGAPDDEVAESAPVFDEEMLRDMVAEIVRQELQGALGERITRNVRKLVRREIQRALTAHDLL